MGRLKDWINQVRAKLSLKEDAIVEKNNSISSLPTTGNPKKDLVNKVLLLMSKGTLRGTALKMDQKPSEENTPPSKPKP